MDGVSKYAVAACATCWKFFKGESFHFDDLLLPASDPLVVDPSHIFLHLCPKQHMSLVYISHILVSFSDPLDQLMGEAQVDS